MPITKQRAAAPRPGKEARSPASFTAAGAFSSLWMAGFATVLNQILRGRLRPITASTRCARPPVSSTRGVDAARFGGYSCPISSAADHPLGNSVGAIESIARRSPFLEGRAPAVGYGSRTQPFGSVTTPPSAGVALALSRRFRIVTWLILPVVICLSQRLSHACLSISNYTVKLRMAH